MKASWTLSQGLEKPGKTVQLPQCGKQSLTAGEGQVDVGLMPHVEHKAVMGGVKGQWIATVSHNAQIGGKVSACFRHVFPAETAATPYKAAAVDFDQCPDISRK